MKVGWFISVWMVALAVLTIRSKADSEFDQFTLDKQHGRATIATGFRGEYIAITCDGIGNFMEITREVDAASVPSVQSVPVVLRLTDANFSVSANQRRYSDELAFFDGDIVEHKEFLLALLQSSTLEIMWDGASVKLNASEPLRQEFVRNCADMMYMKLD